MSGGVPSAGRLVMTGTSAMQVPAGEVVNVTSGEAAKEAETTTDRNTA
jgi:hypothetical protein